MGCLVDLERPRRRGHLERGSHDPAPEEDTMGDLTGVVRRPRRASLRTARTSAALIGVALLVTACGGSPSAGSSGSPSTGGSTNSPSAVAFSRCMRTHGVPNYPDPDGNGTLPKGTAQQFGVSDSRYQTAQKACAHLLPNSGGVSQAVIQRAMNGMRRFAQCMRSHGVSNWPDPTTDRAGYPAFYLQGEIDMNAPQIVTKIHACQHLVPTTRVGGGPAGVPMCPGDRPGPDATSTCGGPNQGR
jgi:hypothetical protein